MTPAPFAFTQSLPDIDKQPDIVEKKYNKTKRSGIIFMVVADKDDPDSLSGA
jgi:hypothetical protein